MACPGPAEVAGDLGAGGRLVQERQAREGLDRTLEVPPLARVQRRVGRDREVEVQAEVDDDADRPHQRRAEVAELVLGPLELADLVHELLGVQRPALAVAGPPREEPVRARQPVRQRHLHADLQVVPGKPSWYAVDTWSKSGTWTASPSDHQIVPSREKSSLGPWYQAASGAPGATVFTVTLRICSGTSKCTSVSFASAISCRSCIASRNASWDAAA
jgi:hypothetical protein